MSDQSLIYEIGWLHLSDLHFAGHADPDLSHRRVVLSALKADLRRLLDGGVPAPTVIALTGDVGFSGAALDANEYTEAAALVESFTDVLPASKLMIVPGNHDVARTRPQDVQAWRMLKDARSRASRVDSFLQREDDKALLEGRLRGYRGFLESPLVTEIDPDAPLMAEISGWTRTVSGKRLTATFVGLNTALLANDDEDHGNLELGFQQVQRATPSDVGSSVTVLMTHHPLDWLSDFDEVAPILERTCDIHLFGHLHIPGSRLTSVWTQDGIVAIGAGATYHGRTTDGVGAGEYAYSIAALGWREDGQLMLRFWPRVWSTRAGAWLADQAVLGQGKTFGERELPRHQIDPCDLTAHEGAVAAWSAWSSRSMASFGNRRTAFPLDLSVQELFARRVNVPTSVVEEGPLSQPHLLTQAVGEQSVGACLLLGEPGAGKSVAAFELASDLAERGLLPVVIRASEFKALLSPGHDKAEVMLRAVQGALDWKVRPVLIVDGLDEMSGSQSGITNAGAFISAASQQMLVISTCRRREFEEEISRWIPAKTFDRLLRVSAWTIENEFRSYVRRLVGEGLLAGTSLIQAVENSPALRQLASRPLFSRMLTLLEVDLPEITNVTDLYSEYFARLSKGCGLSLSERGGDLALQPQELWRTGARLVYESRLISDEQVNFSVLEVLLQREVSIDGGVARGVMSYVLDLSDRGPVTYGQFIHYSFYEFLVAGDLAVRFELTEEGESARIAERLQHDLPRRMRHFAVEILRRERARDVVGILASAYVLAHEDIADRRRTRVACNLIAYLWSRVCPGQMTGLVALLELESDLFLRNSLYWALCHAGDLNGAANYIRELDSSAEMRSWNRGYLLYYHGDMAQDTVPPFLDSRPLRAWSFTKAEVLEMLDGSEYARVVPPARRAVDLYTLLDFCLIRGLVLDTNSSEIVRRVLDDLWLAGELPPFVASRLMGQGALCLAEKPSC